MQGWKEREVTKKDISEVITHVLVDHLAVRADPGEYYRLNHSTAADFAVLTDKVADWLYSRGIRIEEGK